MSDAIERLAAALEEDTCGDISPANARHAVTAVLSALHLSPDAAAGLTDGSWVAVPREAVTNLRAELAQVFDEIETAGAMAIRAASQQNGGG